MLSYFITSQREALERKELTLACLSTNQKKQQSDVSLFLAVIVKNVLWKSVTVNSSDVS